MSSKAALSILSVAVASSSNLPIIFHMDSMYTCNLNEFPVLVFGITDAQQKFQIGVYRVQYCIVVVPDL